MTSQPEKQTITIHILTNISRSKDNQAMKFGQLYTKCVFGYYTQNVVDKIFPEPFIKNQN